MATRFVAKQRYHFAAPPAKVFCGLTEPKILVRWFLSEANIAPRVRGAFSFIWSGGYQMDSSIFRFEENRAVGFLWLDTLPNGKLAKTRVMFVLTKKGTGTVLALQHSGFRDPAHFAECSARWAYFLTNLKSVLDHGTDLRSPLDW
ncbi:MAG: SRPBCC domain-containing protein [Thermoplasmata archaeon]|nr:SRPBCC domain-containing protein [Thermoplasmata archaeon]